MLKIHYDGIDVVLPLDTKISDVYNLITKQINTNTNKNIPIYKIVAKLKYTNKDKSFQSYATKNKIHFPKNKVEISFERTIRVPVNNSNTSFPLPPGLGSYDLMKVTDDIDNNEWVLPMYQCEAMWMKFYNNSYDKVALKIGCGEVDVISGEKWQDGILTQNPQNYIVLPDQ